jgi:hypothetical protein
LSNLKTLWLLLTDVMSKQKVLGVVASGIMHCGTMLAGCNLSSSRFLPQRETTLRSRPQYIVCLGQRPFPSETDTDRTFFYRDKCNLCHLHGSCKLSHILL